MGFIIFSGGTADVGDAAEGMLGGGDDSRPEKDITCQEDDDDVIWIDPADSPSYREVCPEN